MAYVAKSQRVWDTIKRNINHLYVEREKHAAAWGSYTDPMKFAQMCYRLVITDEQLAKMQGLPEEWWSASKTFTFKFKIKEAVSVVGPTARRVTTDFTAEFDTKHLFPRHWSSWNDEHTITRGRVTQEVLDVVVRRENQIDAVERDKRTFFDGAEQLYNRAKSINQFVKIWEPALGLLDEETIERLRRKVERNASAADQGITQEELDRLNAQYVKAKVSQ